MGPSGQRRSRSAILWLVVTIVLVAAGAVWAVGPIRAPAARVAVLALGADGRFNTEARVEPLDSTASVLRFPLILALFNEGNRTFRPIALRLAMPPRYRLVDADGNALASDPSAGDPLVGYTFPLAAEPVEPGALPSVVPGADRLRLEFARSELACRLDAEVPQYSAAPPYARSLLASTTLFWSLETRGGGRRQTGVLVVRFDSTLVEPPARIRASFGPIIVERPDATVPAFEIVELERAARTECGEPGRAETVDAAIWRTATGRFIVLSYRGAPRKHLFDLDGDSIVELERWDIDGDGHFEARRNAAFPLPADLLPPPPPASSDSLAADSTNAVPDSSAVRRDSARADSSAGTAADTTARADTTSRGAGGP